MPKTLKELSAKARARRASDLITDAVQKRAAVSRGTFATGKARKAAKKAAKKAMRTAIATLEKIRSLSKKRSLA